MKTKKPTEPQLQITFPNGQVYQVPVAIIAKSRADYYAKNDCGQDPSLDYAATYQVEYEYSMESKDELLDWVRNNMDFSPDLEKYVVEIPQKPEKKRTLQNMCGDAEIVIIR